MFCHVSAIKDGTKCDQQSSARVYTESSVVRFVLRKPLDANLSFFLSARGDHELQNVSLELQGGDAQTNAIILEGILSGKETGPKRDMVLMNAGAALACAGLADDMGDGIQLAKEVILSGAALEKLRLLQKASNR